MRPQIAAAKATLYTLGMSQRAMLELALGGSADRVRELTQMWAAGMEKVCDVEVRSFGFDRIDWDKPVVVMANHQSYLDVLALYRSLPKPFGFVAKKSLFSIPAFSGVMRALGCVPVDRSKRVDAVASIAEAARRVQEGNTIAVFPEGTRGPGSFIQPLKKGSFYLAQEAQVPIVPVGIRNSVDRMPHHNLAVYPGPIEAHCGELVPAPPKTGDRAEDKAAREAAIKQVREALGRLAAVPLGTHKKR